MEKLYILLIRLYPFKFRGQYGSEMVKIFKQNEPTATRVGKAKYALSILLSTMPWVIRENYIAFKHDYRVTPRFIKIEYFLGLFASLPFFLIVGHNLLELNLYHRISPLFQLLGTAWIGYSILLPSLTLLLSVSGLAWYAIKIKKPDTVSHFEAGNIPYGGMPIFFILLLLASIAIC